MRDLKTIIGIGGSLAKPIRKHLKKDVQSIRGQTKCAICGFWFKEKAFEGIICPDCKPEQARLQKLFPPQQINLTPEIANRLREMAAGGLCIPEMNKETGLPATAIRGFLTYHNIDYKLKEKSRPKIPQEIINSIKKDFVTLRQSLSQADARRTIREKFKVSHTTISRHTNGIKIDGGAK